MLSIFKNKKKSHFSILLLLENLLYCSKWQLSVPFVLFSIWIGACRKSVDIDGKLLHLMEKSHEVKHYALTEDDCVG